MLRYNRSTSVKLVGTVPTSRFASTSELGTSPLVGAFQIRCKPDGLTKYGTLYSVTSKDMSLLTQKENLRIYMSRDFRAQLLECRYGEGCGCLVAVKETCAKLPDSDDNDLSLFHLATPLSSKSCQQKLKVMEAEDEPLKGMYIRTEEDRGLAIAMRLDERLKEIEAEGCLRGCGREEAGSNSGNERKGDG